MAGKDKIETGLRLLWDDSGGTARDLSADLVPGSLSGPGLSHDEVELTGVSNDVKQYLAGHATANTQARFFLNDTSSTGAFTVLTNNSGNNTNGTLTVQFGSAGADPTTGDPEWEGEHILMKATVVMDGGRAVLDCSWQPKAGAAIPAWGTVA